MVVALIIDYSDNACSICVSFEWIQGEKEDTVRMYTVNTVKLKTLFDQAINFNRNASF